MPAPRSPRWRWPLLVVTLAALYLLLRATGADRVVTTDEPFWLGRSANFFRALAQGDLVHTFQHAHPGVTTMWAGTLGYLVAAPDYIDAFDTNLAGVYGIHQRLRELGHNELDVLGAARLAKVALQTALFALSLVWLRRLFGIAVATIAGTLIALDPFLIGHDRLLHVDGLLTIASLTAVLALAVADTRSRTLWPWLAAGALAALAWLTRTTGLALVAVAGLVLLTDVIAGAERTLPQRLGAAARHGAAWAGAALVVTVALWPVLWVSPETAVTFMVDWIGNAAAEGHELPIFFLGEVHLGDPGPRFYPVTIAWRLSVATSVGLLLAAAVLLHPRARRAIPPRALQATAILLLFAGLYTAGMTLGAKKFDRYVLPVHPVLDIVAALGIVGAARWLLPRRRDVQRWALPVLAGSLLLAQAWTTLAARPWELAAFNPLLGGTDAAAEVVQIGWGEGIDAAADWIVADTGIGPGETPEQPPVVRISGGHAPLLYPLPATYLVEPGPFRTPDDWAATDYYVGYIQQWQRGLSGDVIGYLRNHEPAYTLHIGGLRYVDVWRLDEIPPPPWLTGEASCQWRFDPWLQLTNVVTESDTMTLWFRTLTARDLPASVTISVELIARRTDVPPVTEAFETTLAPRRQRDIHTAATLTIPPLATAGPDAYLPRITITDAATGAVLEAIPPGSDLTQSSAVLESDCGA